MPDLRTSPLIAIALLTLTAPVAARGQAAGAPAGETVITIPKSMLPPAGKCRVWMPDVPASQQPAPTDCTTALRQKPANAYLVFGPAKRDLSPFDVRNPWGPNGSETARRAAARGDTTTRALPGVRNGLTAKQPAPRAEPARTPSTRQIPSTQTAPAAREARPAVKDPPPPPPKKPEKP